MTNSTHVHQAVNDAANASRASELSERPVVGTVSTEQETPPIVGEANTKRTTPCLHIVAQFTYHAEALITGNRAGLHVLLRAVTQALNEGVAESDVVFVNDGEGYTVIADCVESTDELPQPYTCLYVNGETTYWRKRAFNAEVALSRLKRMQSSDGAEAKP